MINQPSSQTLQVVNPPGLMRSWEAGACLPCRQGDDQIDVIVTLVRNGSYEQASKTVRIAFPGPSRIVTQEGGDFFDIKQRTVGVQYASVRTGDIDR